MATYLELVGEIIGSVPGIPQPAAMKIVNKAWEDVRKERLWSWQIQVGEIYTPEMITAGLAAVTQFDTAIQFNTAARVALDAEALAAYPPLVPRQFRLTSGSNSSVASASGSSPVYTMTGYDTLTGIGTLDRPYAEDTNATAQYIVYKTIYSPPFADFLAYVSINNPISGYSIAGKHLRGTADELNRRDPMRGSLGNPWDLFTSSPDSTGLVQHEWWPGPVSQQAYQCTCVRSGMDMLLSNEELPVTVPDNLVTTRSLYYAFRWALAHSGTDTKLKGIPWLSMMTDSKAQYIKDLVKAKRNDNEIMLSGYVNWNAQLLNWLGPLDSNWAMSHDVVGF